MIFPFDMMIVHGLPRNMQWFSVISHDFHGLDLEPVMVHSPYDTFDYSQRNIHVPSGNLT